MCSLLVSVPLVEDIFKFNKSWTALTILLDARVYPFLFDCFISLDDFLIALLKKRIIGIAVGMVLK